MGAGASVRVIPDDDTPPTWAEHAADLEGAQMALSIVRAYLSPNDEDLTAITSRIEEQLDAGDFHDVGAMDAHLVELVLMFGRRVHGRYLDAVLAAMQADLGLHIARYNPDDRQG
jgi:hypothetical protein